MSMSIDGLVSGLDTSSLVHQLMQIERQPQVRLAAQRSAAEAKVTAYLGLNTRFAAVQDAAAVLTAAGGSGWHATTATSSAPDRVAVSASPTAPTGTLTFTVDQLARAHILASSGSVGSLDDQVAAPGSTLTLARGDAEPIEIDLGDGSLGAVVAAINAAGVGVTATAVQVAPGQHRLQLASTATGTAEAIAVDLDAFADHLGSFQEVTAATDARITVGTGPGAYTITSGSNTVADAVPGLSLTLQATSAEPVTITVGADVDAVADRVTRLVDAFNTAASHLSDQQRYDPETRVGGPLQGDSTARNLQQQLASTFAAGGSLAGIGITMQRDGTLAVDRDVLVEALATDPGAVQAAIAGTEPPGGLATRLEALATGATNSSDGTITAAIDGRRAAARQIDRQIDAWDVRLAQREVALRRQFTALETALGRLRDQSSWLAGQLASLPRYDQTR